MCVWHAAVMCVCARVRGRSDTNSCVYVMSHACVWHDSFISMLSFFTKKKIIYKDATGWQRRIGWLRCRPFSAKEPLIIGLFCGKCPIHIRHPMTLRHPVWWFIYKDAMIIYKCAMTHSCVCLDECMCVTYRIHMCDNTHETRDKWFIYKDAMIIFKKKSIYKNSMRIHLQPIAFGVSFLHSQISIDDPVLQISFTTFRWKETKEIEIGDWI